MRVLLLASTLSYRVDDFARAAERLGVEAVLGTDCCHQLAELWPRAAFGGSLPLELREVEAAVDEIVRDAMVEPFDAIVPTDDPTAEIAARACARLSLPGNSIEAAVTARNKRRLREALTAAGVPCPRFAVFPVGEMPDPARVAYPAVVKPILCSASRGVMRADSPSELAVAWRRLAALLDTPALRAVEIPTAIACWWSRSCPAPKWPSRGFSRTGGCACWRSSTSPTRSTGRSSRRRFT